MNACRQKIAALFALSVVGCGAPGCEDRMAQSPDEAAVAPREAINERPVAADRASSSRALDITFDAIKFPMEKNDDYQRSAITREIEALDARRIRIRGFILPGFQQKGITQFVLVRDNMECCFGPGAALYDCIIVDMQPGKSTNFTVRPVAVEGTFAIRELPGPDGKPLAIYHLDGEAVRN